MKIGELAKRSGLAASRIRFYEASGLIKAVERRANGYRDYGPEAVWILEIITGAQRAGFSLEEIRHLLPEGPNAWRKDGLLDGLKRKVAEIEAMQQRLAQSRAQLLVAIDSIENRPEGMPCDDNTQRVLERLREESAGAVKAHRVVE
ncbi:MerR family transcriptional regulator [Pseudomonas sichuanensis]|uniref:MerR family transcriptional regulator n=1 Tax=Pseudomonas sichuanensis TaxID=2213015 RepID=UPI000DA6523D|nr:MerR family transcriptional regulator [Pseudomonas sichuanensis]